ncbi:MAG: hypothetical protein ACI9XK_003661 [Granulosicoccus sp.]|jgi:hypothetical protein
MASYHGLPIDGFRDALWMDTAVSAPETKKLVGRGVSYDVVVFGDGCSGLNAALAIAKTVRRSVYWKLSGWVLAQGI